MRVVGFESAGGSGRCRNFLRPLLVMHDAISDAIAAQTANAALMAGLKLAADRRDGEYESCEQATGLMKASVDAAVRRLDEEHKREGTTVSGSVPVVGSTAASHIASSFASAASASFASASQTLGEPTTKETVRSGHKPILPNAVPLLLAAPARTVCSPHSEQPGELRVVGGKRCLQSAVQETEAPPLPISRSPSGRQHEKQGGDSPIAEAMETPATEHSSRKPQVCSVPTEHDALMTPNISCASEPIAAEEIVTVAALPLDTSSSPLQPAPMLALSTRSSPPYVERASGAKVTSVCEPRVRMADLTRITGKVNTAVPAALEAQVAPASTSVAGVQDTGEASKIPSEASRELELCLSPTITSLGGAALTTQDKARPENGPSLLLPLLTPYCLVPSCKSTETTHKGPDGRGTLCRTCYNIYKGKKLVLYRTPGMQISVVPHEGSSPVRVVDFEKSSSGASRDFTKPVVVELKAAEQSFIAKRRTQVVNSARNCMRAACKHPASMPGPDGAGTLCSSCGNMYLQKRLVLFQERGTGRLSIVAHQGWIPVEQLETNNADGYICIVPLKDVPKGGVLSTTHTLGINSESASGGEAEVSDWEVEHGLKDLNEERAEAMDIVIDVVDEDEDIESGSNTESMETNPLPEKVKNAIDMTVDYKGELRGCRMKIGLTHHKFLERLRKLFDICGRVIVYYKDNEGDFITIGSKGDTAEMFQLAMHLKFKRLQIKIMDVAKEAQKRPWCRLRRKSYSGSIK